MFGGAKITNSLQLDLIQHKYKAGIADQFPGVCFNHIRNSETWYGAQYRQYELSIQYNYNISTNDKKIIQKDELRFNIRLFRNSFKLIGYRYGEPYKMTLNRFNKIINHDNWLGPLGVDRGTFHEEIVLGLYRTILAMYVLERPLSEILFIEMFESHIDRSLTGTNPNTEIYNLLHTNEIHDLLAGSNKVVKFSNYVYFPESIRTNNGQSTDLKDRIQCPNGEINTKMIDAISNLAELDVI
jgi:hypothetical protein